MKFIFLIFHQFENFLQLLRLNSVKNKKQNGKYLPTLENQTIELKKINVKQVKFTILYFSLFIYNIHFIFVI